MIPVDGETLREIAPRFSGVRAERQSAIISAVGEILAPTLKAHAITTRLRISHFLAQVCHESAGFRATEEFADGSDYEGREDLGNTHPGDGPRYKGRGLLQLTGRARYRQFSSAVGVDLEKHPERAADPALSVRIACAYWKSLGINSDADADDLLRVTRKVNGGTNGLADRRILLARAKAAVARIEGFRIEGAIPDASGRPVLRRGSKAPAVAALQTRLREWGFPLAVDGDYGAATELAVLRIQAYKGLAEDGICGPRTWAAIM